MVLGNEDRVTLASLVNLASSYENLQRFSEAIPLYSEAVKGVHLHTPFNKRIDIHPTHPRTAPLSPISPSLNHPLFTCGQGMRKTLGDDHDSTLIAMHCLGYCYQRMSSNEVDETGEHGSGSEAGTADGGSQGHASDGRSGLDITDPKDKAKHSQQAKELYIECLTRRRQVSGDESEATLKTLHQLATVLSDNDELDASEAMFAECVEKRRRVCGEDSQAYLASVSGLANVCTRRKDHGRALQLMEECLEQRVKGDTISDTPSNALF